MVEAFVPTGYCSKTFWPHQISKGNEEYIPDTTLEHKQPFSVYHLEQPHHIRIKYGHLGASPLCRANAKKSMQLLRRVLQPAINHDIVEVFRKYIMVFREAAENVSENMSREPFLSSTSASLNIDTMVAEVCQDALTNAKTLFNVKDEKDCTKNKAEDSTNLPTNNLQVSSIPNHMIHGKRRAASPDFPWQKRLKDGQHDISQRRSLSPVSKKRPKNTGALLPPRRYGSPHRKTKEIVRKRIENWDPSRLTVDTEFVMGTKANRALGLGATRGRIYMKHPDLFKYAGDHEDKKWMVKHNCMAATGGKNAFILMAEDVMHLYETEYRDSPGTIQEELQFFKLPEFVLEKMRRSMINEKKIRVGKLSEPGSDFPPTPPSFQSPLTESTSRQAAPRTIRPAAQLAAAAISAASLSPDHMPRMAAIGQSPSLRQFAESGSNRSDTDSSGDLMSDNGMVM